MIGKTARELFSGRLGDLMEERDRQFLESRAEQFFDETSLAIPGIGTRVATSSRVPIVDENGQLQFMLGIINDVTDRRRAEDAERHNAEMMTATITSMADAVLVTDEDGRVIVANPAAKALSATAQTSGRRIGHSTYERFLPDGVTPFPSSETPIARAVRGESVDDLEIVIRPLVGVGKSTHLDCKWPTAARHERSAQGRSHRVPRRYRGQEHRTAAAAGAEDGRDRPAHRRHRA